MPNTEKKGTCIEVKIVKM